MTETALTLVISYGQSLSVGAEGYGAISKYALYPQNALMLNYVNRDGMNLDWGARGPNGAEFNESQVDGFVSLKNNAWESHTTSMINTLLHRIDLSGAELPTFLNISAGQSGTSIDMLSDKSSLPYNNLLNQVKYATNIAEMQGREISSKVILYWKQGASDQNMNHTVYNAKLNALYDSINNDLRSILDRDVSIEFFNDISGGRGAAWGNLDFVLQNDFAHLAAEVQWDHTVASDGVVTSGAFGGHKSPANYFMQGAEAGHKIADYWLNERSSADLILMSGAEIVGDNQIIVSFSGLLGNLVVDKDVDVYSLYNNSVDLGLFAYNDSGIYTGAHPALNSIQDVKIHSENSVIITMSEKISSTFYIGIAGGDGDSRLKGTPLRDSQTIVTENFFKHPDIDVFNAYGGVKRFVPYHYIKVGPQGLVADAFAIARGADLENINAGSTSSIVSLNGTIKDDVFIGGSGNDKFLLRWGNDSANGNAGADKFVLDWRSKFDGDHHKIENLNFLEGDVFILSNYESKPVLVNGYDAYARLVALSGVTEVRSGSDAILTISDLSGASVRLTLTNWADTLAETNEDDQATSSPPPPTEPATSSPVQEQPSSPSPDPTNVAPEEEVQVDPARRLIGSAKDDLLLGGSGDDNILLRWGDDQAIGNAGADKFVFDWRSKFDGDHHKIEDLNFLEGDVFILSNYESKPVLVNSYDAYARFVALPGVTEVHSGSDTILTISDLSGSSVQITLGDLALF